MDNKIYDHMKCSKCTRIHPIGQPSCVCGTVLGTYGIPCTKYGEEKPRDIGDVVIDRDSGGFTPPPPPPPPPPNPQESQLLTFIKKYGLCIVAAICFVGAAVTWDDRALNEAGPFFLIGGIAALIFGCIVLFNQPNNQN